MAPSTRSVNFIRQIIDHDLETGMHRQIVTRFPPEPNGYLHIGHAKSIWLNFGIKDDYGGQCMLRFDDTNPEKENQEYLDAIEEDVRWLGYAWTRITHASDYFDQFHDYAVNLIEQGLAYVDSQTPDQIRSNRGTLSEPGTDSPYRNRSTRENRKLFHDMKAGKFPDGTHVLRARIDMSAANLNLRDPVLYRIRHHEHPRTGNRWCIYPMYDFAHGQADAIEGVTHSLCTMEFEDHRALYDWFIEHLPVPSRPRQIEFSRLNLNHTVMSKRMLTLLIEQEYVSGWDDPRLPTLAGLRRRGYPPESIRNFIGAVGITRKNNLIDVGLLENCVRETLDPVAPRTMAVLDPLKVVIENYPEGQFETLEVPNHPGNPDMGTRKITLGREVYIERDDYMDDPPKKYFRLGPDREVRLRYAFIIRCTGIVRDASGRVQELRCRYDPDTRGGNAPSGRKVRGIIHWVSVQHCINAEARLYDRLFSSPDPLSGDRVFTESINPASLESRHQCKLEPGLGQPAADTRYQFERKGYFYPDRDSRPGHPVFNRIVTLRDTWARISRQRIT